MSKRTIILLLVCTAILIAVSVTAIHHEPAISDIFISSTKDISEAQMESLPASAEFNDPASDIYLIILARYLTEDDSIEVRWHLKEGGKYRLVQEDSITPEKKGSGKIIVSLARKNSLHREGDYMVEVLLTGLEKVSKSFSVTSH